MTKPISDYTVDELSAKIQAIKAERERTANALKRYEEELERKKQEVPLGVPCSGSVFVNAEGKLDAYAWDVEPERYSYNVFHTRKSAQKHAEMLVTWRKALVDNSKGELIDIKVLLPLLKKGWVAMDKDGRWFWYKYKPIKIEDKWRQSYLVIKELFSFNLKPAENWEESLMECGI